MNKEIADKWIAALRSGKYTQATGRLRTPKGFCCLGVLCDISPMRELWLKRSDGEWQIDQTMNLPPGSVTDWAAMKYGDGRLPYQFAYNEMMFNNRTLAGLNDDGFTFAQIADLIEKYWEVL